MPSAAMVASSEDTPAEISGSGTPVIGSRPMTAPMLTSACTDDPGGGGGGGQPHERVGHPAGDPQPGVREAAVEQHDAEVPIRPSSSPRIAKMKSFVAFGTQPHFSLLSPSPTPNRPPEPIAHFPLEPCWLLARSGCRDWLRKPVSRSIRYGLHDDQDDQREQDQAEHARRTAWPACRSPTAARAG